MYPYVTNTISVYKCVQPSSRVCVNDEYKGYKSAGVSLCASLSVLVLQIQYMEASHEGARWRLTMLFVSNMMASCLKKVSLAAYGFKQVSTDQMI